MVANQYTLPVLDYAAELCGFDMQHTGVLARQHLLSTTYDLFEKLFKKNLNPKHVFLLGKCYSTNKDVLNRFINSGAYVSPHSDTFDSYRTFDEQTQQAIEELLAFSHSSLSNLERVLVIDDGGDLLLAANGAFKNTFGVEQTSSGYRKLNEASLKYPVVNVARCEAKLRLESPMIAGVVAEKIQPYLRENSNVLVVGNGAIGNCVYELLGRHYSVTSYDISRNKQALFSESRLKLDAYDLIVGCTGNTILQPKQLEECKKGVVLASASSSDIEFPAIFLRKQLPRYTVCHKTISINEINLLNSGFPINFDGNKDNVPPEKIQLTRSLLLIGINQALQSCENGLIALNTGMQNKIIEKYAAISSG